MFLRQAAAVGSVFLLSTLPVCAHGADRGKPTTSIGGKAITIDYGRPLLKTRDMLSKAEVGKAWRLGADAPTTLTTDADLSFGSIAVPKGAYTLTATKTSETAWVLNIVRTATGSTTPQKVGDVPLEAGTLGDSVEQLTIDLHSEGAAGSLMISWGKTSLKASFTGR
jgi:hypothetical protein